ncbi:MAG: hypothetical protein OXD50_04665 [Chloroflexi bacterium]|nr:hypothetical protein [Chloroflexota bacterium]
MLDRQQAVQALGELLAAYWCLEGLGGAALRARRGLEMDQDRDALMDWDADELAAERREAQTQLTSLLDDDVRSGLADLLFRVSAVTGLSPDETQVQQRLVNDYGLGDVLRVRPLLREVAGLLRPRSITFLLRGLRAVDEADHIWRPYDHWNTALSETVFNKEHSGRSVYLDIEPEILRRAAEAIWPPLHDADDVVETGLRRTVRRTCVGRHFNAQPSRSKAGKENIGFDTHAERVVIWHGERHVDNSASDIPPPSIALLAACSLAAERMRTDSDKAATNYYGRLAEVLDLTEERASHLGGKYREHALLLWESLNVWLRDLHGQRGLPTAVSFGHQRFVSLPISQALIRAQERDRLSEFFARYQFNPGQQVARDDMEGMLGHWIPSSGASGLRDVWGRGPEMRRRIADVVCTELEHWTGEVSVAAFTGRQQRSLLVAATWYEEPEAEFAAFLCVRSSESESLSGEYRTDSGKDVRVQRDPDGLLTLSSGEGDPLRERALVEAALKGGLHLEHKTLDVTLSLAQQQVIVLLFDQLRQVYIQSAHVELGREMLLLVDDALTGQVRLALEESAEDGFSVAAPEVHSLSARWTLFSNVRLNSLPSVAGEDLQSLRPLSRTQVELEGGVQLTDGRWHSQAPPSIIAVDGHSRSFNVTLHSQSNLDEKPRDLGTHAGQASIALASRELADGDYRIVLTEEGGAEITSRALKLRSGSSAHLDPPQSSSEDLAHPATPTFSPRSALSAGQVCESTGDTLQGAVFDHRSGLRAVPETRLRPAMGGMEPFESIESWLTRVAGEATDAGLREVQSLLRRGLVEHRQGKLVLTEAGKRDIASRNTGRNRKDRPSLSSSRSRTLNVDLDLILDALSVIGAGSWNAFRRLIDHSDEERYKPHEALRTLRALGYLDVEVNHRSAAPQQWSLSPPALLVLATRTSAVFTGRRPPELVERLIEAASAEAADVVQSEADGRPARIQLDAEHSGVLQNIANAVGIPLIFDLPRRILERMPTIHEILVAQPELFVPDECTFGRFDRASNSWRRTDASDGRLAGGYQIRFPTGEQRNAVWTDGIWRECGSATAKYAGAAAVGEHIMAYDEERQELTCLLGARPPGLFERALILCSGELPQTPGDHRCIYGNVPDNVHRWIAAKLGPAGWRR